jgi:hypothetical protein
MLEEVADLPSSAPYALEFLAYFGAASFLLVAKWSGGTRCLLYSLLVFGHLALLAQHLSMLRIFLRLALALPECANSGSASCGSLAPWPCWHSVAPDSQTLCGWCWPFLNVPIQGSAYVASYGQLAAHSCSEVSVPPSTLLARSERKTGATAPRHCGFMLLLAP